MMVGQFDLRFTNGGLLREFNSTSLTFPEMTYIRSYSTVYNKQILYRCGELRKRGTIEIIVKSRFSLATPSGWIFFTSACNQITSEPQGEENVCKFFNKVKVSI